MKTINHIKTLWPLYLVGTITLAIILFGSLSANAQTNTPQSFFTTVTKYFTEFNPNLTNTFGAHKGEAWTSVDSIQGNGSDSAKLADAIGLQYSVYDHLSLENVLRTSGIAGVIVSDQLGLGINFVLVDAKITLYGDVGYTLENNRTFANFKDSLFGEVGVRAKKALTENTYAGVGLGVQLPNASQVYQFMVGFTF